MTELKCPYCRHKLETWAKYTDGTSKVWCPECNIFGDSKLFEDLNKNKQQIKKLRKQNRILRESLGEYFNKWINASIQLIKDKDQIRVLTEQEQARHQLIIDQIKGLK